MIYTSFITTPNVIKVNKDLFFNIRKVEEDIDAIDSYVYFKLPGNQLSQQYASITPNEWGSGQYPYDRLTITFERESAVSVPGDTNTSINTSFYEDTSVIDAWSSIDSNPTLGKLQGLSTQNNTEVFNIGQRLVPKATDGNLARRQLMHSTFGYNEDVFKDPPPGVTLADLLTKTDWTIDDSFPLFFTSKEVLFHKTFNLDSYLTNLGDNSYSLFEKIAVAIPATWTPQIPDYGTPAPYDFDPSDALGFSNFLVREDLPDSGKSIVDLAMGRTDLLQGMQANLVPNVSSRYNMQQSYVGQMGSFSRGSQNISQDGNPIGGADLSFQDIQLSDTIDLGVFDGALDGYRNNYYQVAAAAWATTIPPRFDDSQIPKFTFNRVEKQIEDLEFALDTKFRTNDRTSPILVTMKLFKRGSSTPDATYTQTVDLSDQMNAYYAITTLPQITVLDQKSESDVKVKVSIPGPDNAKCSSFNLYMKGVDSAGTSTSYLKIGNFAKDQTISNIVPIDKFNYLRAIPVDKIGRESSIYNIKSFGQGHPSVRRIVLTTAYRQTGVSDSLEKIQIRVHNVPDKATVKIYKRDITDDQDSPVFRLLGSILADGNSTVVTHDLVKYDRYVEYVATSDMSPSGKRVEFLTSNYLIVRHPSTLSKEKITNGLKIQINEGSFQLNLVSEVKANVSFTISTTLTPNAKRSINESIKKQFPDLYSRYLDPANNKASPLGSDAAYDALIGHEVVRTNMKTAERHTFPIVYSETFVDDDNSREIYGIPPVNPQDTYQYEVFSYARDPITLLENYIERGRDDLGFEYFYLPYKWYQPKVLSTGVLYPDDANGYPIVEQFDTLISVGLQDSYTLKGAKEITEIKDVSVRRVNIDTVLVTWNFDSTFARGNDAFLYEGFIVMKNYNGIKSILGYACKPLFYDRVDSSDAGNGYYTVIPVMQDQTTDTPGHSNVISIDPNDFSTEKFRVATSPPGDQSVIDAINAFPPPTTATRTVARGY